MEVHVPGHVTHWATSGFRAMVEKVLPNAQPHQITALLRSQKHHVDLAVFLKDIGGFHTVTGSKGRADGVSYINAYCTEMTAIYQLFDGGLFRRHTARELLPGNLSKLMSEVEKIGEIFSACQQDNGLEGNARFEVRIPMQDALDKHYRLDQPLIDACVLAIPLDVWWSVPASNMACDIMLTTSLSSGFQILPSCCNELCAARLQTVKACSPCLPKQPHPWSPCYPPSQCIVSSPR
jgi:hypothetical protein